MNCNPSEVYSLGFLYLDFNVRCFCVSLFRKDWLREVTHSSNYHLPAV